MNITIPPATPKDFPAMLSLIHEFAIFQKTSAKVTITLAQVEKEKDIFQCFVAESTNQTIIGFASFYFTFYSWSGKGIYLDDLYVYCRQDKFVLVGSGRGLILRVHRHSTVVPAVADATNGCLTGEAGQLQSKR